LQRQYRPGDNELDGDTEPSIPGFNYQLSMWRLRYFGGVEEGE